MGVVRVDSRAPLQLITTIAVAAIPKVLSGSFPSIPYPQRIGSVRSVDEAQTIVVTLPRK
jgi:hypothetical protein